MLSEKDCLLDEDLHNIADTFIQAKLEERRRTHGDGDTTHAHTDTRHGDGRHAHGDRRQGDVRQGDGDVGYRDGMYGYGETPHEEVDMAYAYSLYNDREHQARLAEIELVRLFT